MLERTSGCRAIMGKAVDFWSYIRERESIRLRRVEGQPWPWTRDPILQAFKFTNVRRRHDRTTQAFMVTYKLHTAVPPDVALYNCAVRRFFGTAEFGLSVGWLDSHAPSTLRNAELSCPRPWTGAYIIRAGAAGTRKVDSVIEYMDSLWARAAEIVTAIEDSGRWEAGYQVMRKCFGFGPFMAKEVLQDYLLWLEACGKTVTDAGTFTPVGPGAARGLNRLFERPINATQPELAMLVEIQMLLEGIQPIWLRTFNDGCLTAHDIQFCLCEYDKYERTRLGEGRPKATYKRRAS